MVENIFGHSRGLSQLGKYDANVDLFSSPSMMNPLKEVWNLQVLETIENLAVLGLSAESWNQQYYSIDISSCYILNLELRESKHLAFIGNSIMELNENFKICHLHFIILRAWVYWQPAWNIFRNFLGEVLASPPERWISG